MRTGTTTRNVLIDVFMDEDWRLMMGEQGFSYCECILQLNAHFVKCSFSECFT